MSAQKKIGLYDLHYRLLGVSEDGQALFESDEFGCWFASENPDITRYLASQLEDFCSVKIMQEAPFSIFLQKDAMIIQSVERLQ